VTEANFWRDIVRPRLGVFGVVQRLEIPNVPDTLYCIRGAAGLIELKHAYEWPAKSVTPMHFAYFTVEQVNWIEAWHDAGGRCFVLAQVGHDYLLYGAKTARIIQRGVTRRIHIANSLVHDYGKFPTGAIVKCLVGSAAT